MDNDMILILAPDFIRDVQDRACTEDFCFICRRCTDHWGEHSDAQLLAYANR